MDDREARAIEHFARAFERAGNPHAASCVREREAKRIAKVTHAVPLHMDETIDAMLAFADREKSAALAGAGNDPAAVEREAAGTTIDSSAYKRTFYGILNADGAFWTPIAFDSERSARAHINAFFADRYQLERALLDLEIVPCRSQLSTIRAGEPAR